MKKFIVVPENKRSAYTMEIIGAEGLLSCFWEDGAVLRPNDEVAKEAFNEAMENVLFMTLGEILGMEDSFDNLVVTSKDYHLGGGYVFIPDIADMVCKRLGANAFRFSLTSFHEAICHPVSMDAEVMAGASGGVRKIDQSNFVTGHVYEYSNGEYKTIL